MLIYVCTHTHTHTPSTVQLNIFGEWIISTHPDHQMLKWRSDWQLCRYTGGSWLKNLPASAGDPRGTGLIPGLGRSLGVGNGTPLQYSCLGHPMNRREEPGGLQSMGLQSHRHDWATESTHALQLSDHFSRSVMAYSLRPHGLQHIRLPCPSPAPRTCSNSCPSSWWRHPTISSSVIPFSSSYLSQHQGLFQWVSSSHQVAKLLEFQLQHQSFQWTFRTDL